MMARWFAAGALIAASLGLEGCNGSYGLRKDLPEFPRPDAILDFPTLYQQNCAGCHGAAGKNGPAYPLANPEYQSLVDESILRDIIARGDPGTMMPPFAISAGGTLTDRQVDALVTGMRAAWWKPKDKTVPQRPTYRSSAIGNAAHGETVYLMNCAPCHGDVNDRDSIAGSVTEPAFLALLNDEVLRTIVIAGRPDVGMPNWKGDIPGGGSGHPEMTDQQVADVVAWLSSHRANAVAGASEKNTATEKPATEAGGGAQK